MAQPTIGGITRILDSREVLNVDTGTAYDAGDFIGEHSEKYLSYDVVYGPARRASGYVVSLIGQNQTGSAAAVNIKAHLFRKVPTVAGLTDNSALAFANADLPYYIGTFEISTWEADKLGSDQSKRYPFELAEGETKIYALLEAEGALDNTGGAVGNFAFQLGVELNQDVGALSDRV